LPCRWHKESIIVLDEVIINPPYDIDNCKTSKTVGSTELLARVRKVERKEDWQTDVEMQMVGLARLTPYDSQ
ncbi:20428_t:CDS:2, partial [Gigaspora margarita]